MIVSRIIIATVVPICQLMIKTSVISAVSVITTVVVVVVVVAAAAAAAVYCLLDSMLLIFVTIPTLVINYYPYC